MIAVERTTLDGVLLMRPPVFRDDRGHFLETFNEAVFRQATGLAHVHFVQDNESRSHRHVLRGLHFQVHPHAQGKLVRVLHGSVLDVVVDIRRDSPTFGRHVSVRLDAQDPLQLWIPPGLAHGFLALEQDTVFAYKCTDYYQKTAERTIRWNDPDLAIDWGVTQPLVSEKDQAGYAFKGPWDGPIL